MCMITPSPRWSRRGFLLAGATSAAGLSLFGWPRAVRSAESASAAVPPGAPPITFAELKPVLQELVREMEKKVPYASVLVTRRTIKQFSIDDHTREINDLFPSVGAVFTAYNGAWFEEAATSELDPDALRATAKALAAGARQEKGGRAIEPGPPLDQTFDTQCAIDPRTLPLGERFDRVAAVHSRARAALGAEFVNFQIETSESTAETLFVNRTRSLHQTVLRSLSQLSLYASRGQHTVNDFLQNGATAGLEAAEVSDEEIAALAAETRALLDAGPVPSGEHVAVVDGTVAGTIAHESFGHGVELDMFVKKRALAEQFVGKRVGSDLVNIIDDPSLPRGYGSYFFDDEGVLSGPTQIVKGGIFKRGLSDLMSANALGIERSANGRRQDYTRKTYARMSNTFFERGTSSLEELIGGVKQGYYVTKLTHGMEDPKGWGIMVVALVGQEIRDGKLTGRYVSPVGITGYVPDVLASVDGVASDFIIDPGACGKGFKEFVPISTGGPHIRFRARLA